MIYLPGLRRASVPDLLPVQTERGRYGRWQIPGVCRGR